MPLAAWSKLRASPRIMLASSSSRSSSVVKGAGWSRLSAFPWWFCESSTGAGRRRRPGASASRRSPGATGQGRPAFPDDVAEPAADIRIDFVEDDRSDGIVGGQYGLEREHGARQLAARSDLPQGAERLAGIGRQHELQRMAPPTGTSPTNRFSPSEIGSRLQSSFADDIPRLTRCFCVSPASLLATLLRALRRSSAADFRAAKAASIHRRLPTGSILGRQRHLASIQLTLVNHQLGDRLLVLDFESSKLLQPSFHFVQSGRVGSKCSL